MQFDHEKNGQKYQRAGCSCNVPAGEQFCGEHCRLAASGEPTRAEEPDSCACGHKECAERS